VTRDLTRRELLTRGGATALGLAAAGCEAQDPYALEKPPVPGAESWTRFEERTITSACAQCAAGCGIRVRVVEGRAVKIEGEPRNPINQGGIGPRGLAGLQVLYDPDRIRQPLRRKGPRGSGEWEAVSWESALAELAARLRGLRERGEPERLAIVCGRERGMMRELWERFAAAYGTPNFFDASTRESGALVQAAFAMQGVREHPAYDWERTRYVLSLGAGVLEASCQAITFARATAWLKRGRSAGRGKIVQVEPSRSRTAAAADEWIQVAPGTHAAFALGLAHALVRDGAYDRAFVEAHGFGFEDWTDEAGATRRGFRSLLADYAPARVAEICGVAPATIERIARELAETRPAFALTDPRATEASNGLQTAMAVQALNALLGAIERPGGVLVQREAPLAPWPALAADAAAEAGLRRPRVDGVGAGRFPLATSAVEALPEALLSGAPDRPDTLLLYYANPCYAWTSPERWRRALAAAPFVATFTPFLDETAAEAADLILPDHTYLERFEDAAPAPATGGPIFGIRQPVVEPLHATRPTGDVVIGLARAIGGGCAGAFPWQDFREAVLARAAGLHEAGRGSIRAADEKKFLAKLLREGVWHDDEIRYEAWDEAFPTPSGRFEFFSLGIWRALHAAAERAGKGVAELLAEWGAPGNAELLCMPHHAEIRWAGGAGEYPLLLEPWKPGTYAEGSGANLPLLRDLAIEPGGAAATSAALHPDTAAALGVGRGDLVALVSPAGRVELPVSVHPGVRPGSVRVARGGGHTAFGRFARGRGANVMELVAPGFDPLGGFPALVGTRVRVERIAS
jgi:anaerobic selenocysteine-containing dehydrogenase